MTPIEKSVSRGCPDIVNDEGRCLDATLRDDNGGSLVLKWRGLRKPSEVVFPLEEIMNGGKSDSSEPVKPTGPVLIAKPTSEKKSSNSSKGVDSTEYLAYGDLINKLHILPNIDLEDRKRLVDVAKDLQLHAMWMSEESELSFETYKEQLEESKLFINQ